MSSTLECKATHYLKRWSGLARSADPSRLYLPKDNGGLQPPPASVLYKKLGAALLLTSRDPVTQHVTIMEIQALQKPKFQPMQLTRDVMVEDLGVSRRGLPQQGQLMKETDEEAAEVYMVCCSEQPPVRRPKVCS